MLEKLMDFIDKSSPEEILSLLKEYNVPLIYKNKKDFNVINERLKNAKTTNWLSNGLSVEQINQIKQTALTKAKKEMDKNGLPIR